MRTEIEWKKGLPDVSGWYCILTKYTLTTSFYSAKHKKWNAYDWESAEEAKEHEMTKHVICWAELIDSEEIERRLEEEK